MKSTDLGMRYSDVKKPNKVLGIKELKFREYKQ